MFITVEIIGIAASLIVAVSTVILTARKLYLKVKAVKETKGTK